MQGKKGGSSAEDDVAIHSCSMSFVDRHSPAVVEWTALRGRSFLAVPLAGMCGMSFLSRSDQHPYYMWVEDWSFFYNRH